MTPRKQSRASPDTHCRRRSTPAHRRTAFPSCIRRLHHEWSSRWSGLSAILATSLLTVLLQACSTPQSEYEKAVGDWVCKTDSESIKPAWSILSLEPQKLRVFDLKVHKELGQDYVTWSEYKNISSDTNSLSADRYLLGWTIPRVPAEGFGFQSKRTFHAKVEGDSLIFEDTTTGSSWSGRCMHAEVGVLVDELAQPMEEARALARKADSLVGQFWFGATARILRDERCQRYRKAIKEFSAMPAVASDRLIAGQLTVAQFDGCTLPNDEVDLYGALEDAGIKISTPAGWRQRLDILASQGGQTPTNPTAQVRPETIIKAPDQSASSNPPKGASDSKDFQPMTGGQQLKDSAPADPSNRQPRDPMRSNSDSAATDNCAADAPQPQSPEDFAVVENGRRYLTGRQLRLGSQGQFYIVEAALGYDGSCRPSPYQVYVYYLGNQVGTLASSAMTARTSGAILNFKAIDEHQVEMEVAQYSDSDAACCPSKIEKQVVLLDRFVSGVKNGIVDQSAQPIDVTSEQIGETANQGPSFDCGKASTPTEHAICSSPTLSELDTKMASLYRRGLEYSTTAEADRLKGEQRAWLKNRAAECGGDAACLDDFSRKRISELK